MICLWRTRLREAGVALELGGISAQRDKDLASAYADRISSLCGVASTGNSKR